MLFLKKRKDGGPESTVTGYWLVELKSLFSILFLVFKGKSREAFHSHAFNAISWVLRGQLTEHVWNGGTVTYKPSWRPIYTPCDRIHKVDSDGTTWVFTLRGPWRDKWLEHRLGGQLVTLTHGRVEV